MLEAVTALLDAGANPNLAEDRAGEIQQTAFQIACAHSRDDKILEKLLSKGADPMMGEDAAKGIYAPLHDLAMAGRYGVLESAHHAGVNIDKPAYNGVTCLMLAAGNGAAKTIEMLLECGADPAVKDKKGLDAAAHLNSSPRDTDRRALLKLMARAAGALSLRREIDALRAEVDSLRRQIAK